MAQARDRRANDSAPQQTFPWHQPKQRKPNGWRDAWHRRLSITWSAIARGLSPSSAIVSMTWSKFDDSFLGDPKLMQVSPVARLVFVNGIVFCNRYLTDGLIETGSLPELWLGIALEDAERTPNELVRIGVWQPRPGGYYVTNFLKYNDSKAEVEDRRAAAAARQKKHREERLKAQAEGEAGSRVTGGNVTPLRGQK